MNGGERPDLEIYQLAVRTGIGETFELREDIPDEAFLIYLERGMTQHLDDIGRHDVLPVQFNYDRWLGGGTQRLL
jgi:hypothetical protein